MSWYIMTVIIMIIDITKIFFKLTLTLLQASKFVKTSLLMLQKGIMSNKPYDNYSTDYNIVFPVYSTKNSL